MFKFEGEGDGDGGGGWGACNLGSCCCGLEAWHSIVDLAVRGGNGRGIFVARVPEAQEGDHTSVVICLESVIVVCVVWCNYVPYL